MERIRYHVPEDGDDAAHPNVFELVSEGAVRVGDVRRHFPLPGRFHLRFRRRVAGLEVWADAADDAAPAPRLQGRILVKASRLAGDAARAPARPPPSPRRASASPGANPSSASSSSTAVKKTLSLTDFSFSFCSSDLMRKLFPGARLTFISSTLGSSNTKAPSSLLSPPPNNSIIFTSMASLKTRASDVSMVFGSGAPFFTRSGWSSSKLK